MKSHMFSLNMFSFFFISTGVRDILNILQIRNIPVGVTENPDRISSYNISSRANLYAPLSNIFANYFPMDFSIIVTLQLPVKSSGYLFTISDIMGNQRLAIKYGEKTSLEYYDQNNLPGLKSPKFDISVADGAWHQMAFSIKGQHIKMFLNCAQVFNKPFARSVIPDIGVNLVAAVGPYFARFGQPFEGHLEQFVLTSDPDAAALQCHKHVTDAVSKTRIYNSGQILLSLCTCMVN